MNDNYRALTRTYRPQAFEDIVSQEHVSNTLKNAIKNNRLSHAYMFCGPRGVGKTTMARVLARAVNEVDTEVDGESLGRTLNIVEMDAASNRKIEDVRSLKEVIRVPPQNGKYKIFIIDEVHMLTKEAFNALLKTLEEPPPHAIFIFATTEPHKVLPTILSRVQRFDFKRIAVSEIVTRLSDIAAKESIQIDEESLHVIAKRADGALRDALGLMDQAIAFCGSRIEYQELLKALNVVDREDLFSFIEAVQAKDSNTGLSLISELLQSGTDIQEFLVTLTEHIRNLYVAHESKRLHLIEATEETRNRYSEQAVKFSEDDLMRMLHLVSEAQLRLKEAQQQRVHFEILMLKLIHMSRSKELGALLKELEALKKNSTNGQAIKKHNKPDDNNDGSRATEPESESSSPNSAANPADEDPKRNKDLIFPAGGEKTASPASKDSGKDDLFGRPSLGYSKSQNTEAFEPEQAAEPHESEKTGAIKGINGIEDVIEKWDHILGHIKNDGPRTLFFQMQRVEVQSLKGRELSVRADNEFSLKLIEENRLFLSKCLKKELGVAFRIHCTVQREKKSTKESLSPYERFKELEKRDPHIRTLVELFGAELEY